MTAGFGLVFTVSSSSECCCLTLVLSLVLHKAARLAEAHKVLLFLSQFLSQPVFAAAETLTKVYRRRTATSSPSYGGAQTGFPGFHYRSLPGSSFSQLLVSDIQTKHIHGCAIWLHVAGFWDQILLLSSGKNEWGMFHNEREIEQVGAECKPKVLFSSVSSPALGGSLFCVWKSH